MLEICATISSGNSSSRGFGPRHFSARWTSHAATTHTESTNTHTEHFFWWRDTWKTKTALNVTKFMLNVTKYGPMSSVLHLIGTKMTLLHKLHYISWVCQCYFDHVKCHCLVSGPQNVTFKNAKHTFTLSMLRLTSPMLNVTISNTATQCYFIVSLLLE